MVTRIMVPQGVRQGSVEGPLLFVLPYGVSCKKLEGAPGADEPLVRNRGRLEAFPDDPEDPVTCGEVTYMDDLIITTVVEEWTDMETCIARVFRIVAEEGWDANVDRLEAIAVARGEGSQMVHADIAKEMVKLTLPDG